MIDLFNFTRIVHSLKQLLTLEQGSDYNVLHSYYSLLSNETNEGTQEARGRVLMKQRDMTWDRNMSRPCRTGWEDT